MRRRIGKEKSGLAPVRLLCAGLCCGALLGALGQGGVLAKETGAGKTESGVTAVIETDKTEYLAGEEIHYTLRIVNTRRHCNLDRTTVAYSNTDGIVAFGEDSMPDELPQIRSGETYELTGVLVGEASVFGEAAPAGEAGNDSDGTTPGGATPDGATPDDVGTPADGGQKGAGDSAGLLLAGVLVLAAAVLALVVLTAKKKKKADGGDSGKEGGAGGAGLAAFLAVAVLAGLLSPVSVRASEAEEIVLRPYVRILYAGQEVIIRAVIHFDAYMEINRIDNAHLDKAEQVTCHDPSVFRDQDGTYYIVGSFLAGASSRDLKDWKSLDNVIQGKFSQEVKDEIRAWNQDESAGHWNDYLWAPDVVYNPAMGKYCMYLSANGDNWKSNIVLLTADAFQGPYAYAGTVVYGGFNGEDYGLTDAPRVTGEETIPERYVQNGVDNRKWGDMYPNCIDPCVFYDDDGNLWMSYGSWSGGIFLLALDEETGLRDYDVQYPTDIHSDAYFGTKIAGGCYVSGEASYIQKIGDYYYLFISYGNLEARGGYNVRVFRSQTPDGGYVDALGNDAFYDKYVFNYNQSKGVRLFGGYRWRTFMNGQVAQGHNSAFVDEDGRAYIVFHTRTSNGTEGHYVKVHQLFVNREGWIVAAPYQTDGEKLPEEGLGKDAIAGNYEVILHELEIDYANLETKKPCFVTLEEDGAITGDYEGSWTAEAGTPYLTLTIDGETYSGVALSMKVENTDIETVVFTALGTGNQLTLWGSREFEQ